MHRGPRFGASRSRSLVERNLFYNFSVSSNSNIEKNYDHTALHLVGTSTTAKVRRAIPCVWGIHTTTPGLLPG